LPCADAANSASDRVGGPAEIGFVEAGSGGISSNGAGNGLEDQIDDHC
jgi:hypothetical protein